MNFFIAKGGADLQPLRLNNRCVCFSKWSIEAECLVHLLVAWGTADRQTGKSLFTAPMLSGLNKHPRNAVFSEHGFHIKVLECTCVCAGESREVLNNTAYSDNLLYTLGEKKCDSFILDGMEKLLLIFFG